MWVASPLGAVVTGTAAAAAAAAEPACRMPWYMAAAARSAAAPADAVRTDALPCAAVAEACLLLVKLPVAAPTKARPDRTAAPLPVCWLADPGRVVKLLDMLDALLVLELLCTGLVTSERRF